MAKEFYKRIKERKRRDVSDKSVLLTCFDHATLARIRHAGYGGKTGLSQREALQAAFVPRRLSRLLSHGSWGQRLSAMSAASPSGGSKRMWPHGAPGQRLGRSEESIGQ